MMMPVMVLFLRGATVPW